MVAAAIRRLAEEKKAKWSIPVKNIVPDFAHYNNTIRYTRTITDMLSHRTGLSGLIPANLCSTGDKEVLLSRDRLFPIVKDLRLAKTVHSAWNHVFFNYAIVSEIIERVPWQRLDAYLGSPVFKPLGMNNTTTQPFFDQGGQSANQFAALADGTPCHLKTRQVFKKTFFEASGGVFLTLSDMMLWAKATLDGFRKEPRGAKTPLKATTLIILTLMGYRFCMRTLNHAYSSTIKDEPWVITLALFRSLKHNLQ